MSVSIMLPVYQKVDKLMLPVLWLLFIVSLALSPLYDTWSLALLIGLPLAIIPTFFIITKSGSFLTRSIVAISLMAFMALHIHQAAGMTELHFGIFVTLAILLSYTDWKVIIIAAVTIAIHHLSFNFLQQYAMGPLCFTKPSLEIVLLHATYVVVEAGMLSYLAIMMNRIIKSGSQLSVIVEEVTKIEGKINLVLSEENTNTGLSIKLNNMLSQLHTTLSYIREQVSSISSSASSIAEGSAQIAEQSESQLLHLQKTVSSVEVLTQTVQKNTGNILKANELMLVTANDAVKGGEVVSQVVEKMTSINNSSSKITEIISVIDGIAFQTNILALNAAVEAARAGEQGRGFAVVATEVRSLAQRSAEAAKEIKNLINTSVVEVEEGNQLVKNAGNAIHNIVSSINSVKDIMQEISEASKIQTKEIEDTNKLLHHIQDSNQEHDKLIMKTASLADNIQQQTVLLEKDMVAFKLA